MAELVDLELGGRDRTRGSPRWIVRSNLRQSAPIW